MDATPKPKALPETVVRHPADPPLLTEDELTVISLRASATRESVLRRLVGLPVRGRTGERIDAALRGES